MMCEKLSVAAAATVAALLCASLFASCARGREARLPDLLPTDLIQNTAKRDSASGDVSEYTPLKEDAASEDFISRKYAGTGQATWKCHDPKLFQDPVSGRYYVYSTGWTDGVQVRSSSDGIHWAKHRQSALWDPKDASIKYGHMRWDDDFLKWVGYATNDGTAYSTQWYSANKHPSSWAPTVVYQDGRYYMFHGIITDCLSLGDGTIHPAACITLAIADRPEGPFVPASQYDGKTYRTSSLVRYVWTNESPQNTQIGYSLCHNTAEKVWEKGFGAIDPEFVFDLATGKLMEFTVGGNRCYALTYGSWKGGIALVYIDAKTFRPVDQKTGKVMGGPLDSKEGNSGLQIAGGLGAAYEGAQLVYNGDTGYYYLFVSMGDLSVQYRVGVGRSRDIAGPYLDPSEQSMTFDKQGNAQGYHAFGGKIIGAAQQGEGWGFSSPGGQSILRDRDGRILFACHTRTTFRPVGDFTLQIHQLYFNSEGWPVLNWNEFYGEGAEPERLTMQDIAGSYEAEVTRRSRVMRIDGTAQKTERLTIAADGSVSGAYEGSVTLDSDGNSAVFDLGEAGTFQGFFLRCCDWTLKDLPDSARQTVSFTALNSMGGTQKGEYFFGTRRLK